MTLTHPLEGYDGIWRTSLFSYVTTLPLTFSVTLTHPLKGYEGIKTLMVLEITKKKNLFLRLI